MVRRALVLCVTVFAFATNPSAWGSADSVNVIGGSPTALWPAAGAIQLDGGAGFCSGFLVSRRWVVTTYFCAFNASTLQFIVGVDPTAPTSTSYAVSDVVLDPDFADFDVSHNVALLHLSSSVPATPFIVNDMDEPAVFSHLYILGYGLTSSTDTSPLRKRLGVVTISNLSGTSDSQVPFEGGVACLGDPGGPNFDVGPNGFPVAYSITSYGDEACSEYEIASRTSAEVSFITANVDDACFASAPAGPHCDGIFRNGLEAPLNPPSGGG